MDSIVCTALEEICCQGNRGIPLVSLWSRLSPLSPCVKAHVWRNLLAIPQLRFKAKKNTVYGSSDASIQRLEDALRLDLRIAANEKLRGNFVGLYDAQSNNTTISPIQLRVLERLAVARANGVTQNQLAKEFGIEGNKFFYIMEQLKSRGLIVKQPAIVKVDDGEVDSKTTTSCITTNMIHLTRYAKPLCSSQQRFEICKEEDTLVKDFLPSMQAICDKLEEANDKVLVVSGIKQDLGYLGSHSRHRAWRSVCRRLTDSHVVEEFDAVVNNKVERCLRLLKRFSAKDFKDCGKKQLLKFGRSIIRKSEQTLELPLDNQIYDMVDGQGSKGLAVMEVSERLGIDKKKSYSRLHSICSRVRMHLQAESHKKTRVFRVWTSPHAPDNAENLSCRANNVSINDDTGGLARLAGVLDCNLEESFHEIAAMDLSERKHLPKRKVHPITVENCPRERRILERLKEEKFVLRGELHKWLEKDKVDRKSIDRILKRLQKQLLVHKRVIFIRNRSSVIVFHPSVQRLTPEIVGQIRDRIRSFEVGSKETIPRGQTNAGLDGRRVKSKSKDAVENSLSTSGKRKWLHSISKSPFPVNTGKRAARFSSWLVEHERELMAGGGGVALTTSDLQCGDVLNLFSLVASGELSISVTLPQEGVGDRKRRADDDESDNKKLKLIGEEGLRKEKGFPGIALSVRRLITLPTTQTIQGESTSDKSIYPWVNADGSINKLVFDKLLRRLLGTVMQNPGIPEDEIIKRLGLLNPQSCRKLLELMTLDGYIKVKEMLQTKFTAPPSFLIGPSKPQLIRRKHFFANSNGLFAL